MYWYCGAGRAAPPHLRTQPRTRALCRRRVPRSSVLWSVKPQVRLTSEEESRGMTTIPEWSDHPSGRKLPLKIRSIGRSETGVWPGPHTDLGVTSSRPCLLEVVPLVEIPDVHRTPLLGI